MVTTRSAEKKAAQQSQELALRTRASDSTPTASPSVKAFKSRSAKSETAQEAYKAITSDLAATPGAFQHDDGAYQSFVVPSDKVDEIKSSSGSANVNAAAGSADSQLIKHTITEENDEVNRARMYPSTTTDPNAGWVEMEQPSRSLSLLKRFSSEDLEVTDSQKASNTERQPGQQGANAPDNSDEAEDEDAPPEIASTRFRTPKRKSVGSRNSTSRKKTKLDVETSAPVLDTAATSMDIVELDAKNTIPGESSASREEEDMNVATDVIASKDESANTVGIIQYSPNHQSSRVISPVHGASHEEGLGPALKRQQQTLPPIFSKQRDKPDSNLPPRFSSSKSAFRQQAMQSRPNFRTTSTWSAKRRNFVTSVSSSTYARSLESIR